MCIRDRTQTGQTEDGFAINRYFIDHPEMVLGRQEPVSTAHGMDYTAVSYTHLDVYKRQVHAKKTAMIHDLLRVKHHALRIVLM